MNQNAISPIKGQTLQTFAFGHHALRVIMREGEPWFVASDVAKALGYARSENMTNLLDPDEKGTAITSTLGGPQEMVIINESGLNNAIFSSRKLEARTYRKWVTSEVLPSIRKTGRYAMPQRNTQFQGRVLITRELELQVFQLFLQGHRQAEIRKILRISSGTVSDLIRGRYSFSPGAGQDLTTPELRAAVAEKMIADQQHRFVTQMTAMCISTTNQALANELDRKATEVLASLPIPQMLR